MQISSMRRQIEELKRSTQFPKLTPTSPEFLTLMEEYVREAPRPTEEVRACVPEIYSEPRHDVHSR